MKHLWLALALLFLGLAPARAVDPAVHMYDANIQVDPTTVALLTTVTLTAPRTITLPSASATLVGQTGALTYYQYALDIIDAIGVVNPTTTLTIQAQPGETINGLSTYVLNVPFSEVRLLPLSGSTWVTDNRVQISAGIGGPNPSVIGGIPYFTNTTGTAVGDGGAQGAAHQLQIVDSSAHSVNDNIDLFRVQLGVNIGPPPAQWEIGSVTPTQAAITSLLRIPSGLYSGVANGQDGNPDSAYAGYVVNNNPDISGVGLYIYSGTDVDGTFGEYGTNIVAGNVAGFASNIGHEFQRVFNSEFDTIVYCKAALVSGVCPTGSRPHGLVKGVISELNASAQTLTPPMQAFEVVGSINRGGGQADVPWDIAYNSENGAATRGISLGTVANVVGSNSQDIALVSINSAGTPGVADQFMDAAFNFNILNEAVGTGIQMAATYPQYIFYQSAAGAPTGLTVKNLATSAGTTSNFTLQVGNGNYATLQTGVTTPGLVITASSGNIFLNPGSGAIVSNSGGLSIGGTTTTVGPLVLLNTLIQGTSTPPSSSSAACSIGTETWDANYEYRCVATNTWVRSAHTTF